MKECAICGEKLDKHSLRCSKGHSLFYLPRGETFSIANDIPLIKEMLRQSSACYTEDEIVCLTKEISCICNDANIPITEELVVSIGKDIESKHLEREEIKRKWKDEVKLRQRKQAELEQRQRRQWEEAERKHREEQEESERKRWEIAKRIETTLPVFQGVNNGVVRHEDFIKLIGDVFDTLLYKHLQLQTPSTTFDQKYIDNQTFWYDALRGMHFESKRVSLQGFHITEWIPSAPGRYFTQEAQKSRLEALNYIAYEGREYLPLGKNDMILGGIGSVRLKAKILDSTMIYFLCASSNGISHQGIPIALRESQYRQIIQTIKEYGGCYTNTVGTLRVIPEHLSVIRYHREIPKYCLFVEDINMIRPSSEQDLLTTVAVMYPSCDYGNAQELCTQKGYITQLKKSWTFCSFRGPSQEGLKLAVRWLKDYAIRYSNMDNPPIVSDFDEHYSHFDNPVEFSISQLFDNGFDFDLLRAYQDHYGFTINIQEANIIMGDEFKNISGSTIINKSVVEKSFNKLKDDYGEDVANALLQVAEQIVQSGNREAAELFTGFNEELQKPEPKKPVLRKLWEGIVSALPSLAQLADVGLKITKLFNP